MASFFAELKRRNVFKVGVAYAIVAWLLIQVTDIVAPALHLPDWTVTFIIYLLIIGFPLALFLAWVYELTPEGIKITSSEGPDKFHTYTTGQQLNYTIIGVLILAVILLVVDNYVLDSSEEQMVRSEAGGVRGDKTPVGSVESGGRSEVLPNSVAVLPFDNLSPDPDNAYFAAGIHDTILNELAKIGDMNVISRTAMLRYAGSDKTLNQIADELNVETVMEGSVQYAEGRVLVTAQLINPKTNAHLWSENYDREFAGIFALQADIASNIARALQAKLLPSERAAIEKPMTSSPEAYALYLRAVASVVDLGPFGFGISTDLHRYLDQAIAIDPNFARAYALKALDYVSAIIRPARLNNSLTRSDLERLAMENAEHALAIDPEMGLAYDVFAQVHWFNWRKTDAEANFKMALALSPRDRDVLVDYSVFLSDTGRLVDATTLGEPLLDISPGTGHFVMGILNLYGHNLNDGIAYYENGIQLIGDYPYSYLYYSLLLAIKGDAGPALQQLRILEGFWQDGPVEPYALAKAMYAYARIGRQEDTRRLYDRLQAMAVEYTVSPATWALASLAMGNRDDTYTWLERTAEQVGDDEGYAIIYGMAMNVYQSPVLEQQEFVEVRKRLGPK